MDLVSTTLSRYLKHRFNGINLQQEIDQETCESHNSPPSQNSEKTKTSDPPQTNNQVGETQLNESNPSPPKNQRISNGTTSNDNHLEEICLPRIYNLSIVNSQPCCISFRIDQKFLAAGFENSSIHLWELGKELGSETPADTDGKNEPLLTSDLILFIGQSSTLLAHTGPVYGIEFINNDDLMLSCSEDTTIRLWCLKNKCNLTVFRGHVYPIWSLDVGSQGLLFASSSMDTTARLWRLDRITPLRIFCGHNDDVEVVRFHPNEKYVATGSADSTVRLWSVSDGLMVRLMVGHETRIISLTFHPDGKFLASASCDGIVKLWSLATNLVASQYSVPPAHTISFSPSHNFISSCGVDNVLSLQQLVETSPNGKPTKLIERRNFDLNDHGAKLIQSQFTREDRLFVISFSKEETSQLKSLNR